MGAYAVADYLLDRLAEAGVRHLFGVPGDFTLAFLDHVDAHSTVRWVGCANELGAGYAADGAARVSGLGAISTTFGVGELSAINAVAGSFAEHVPVIHIVGGPTTAVQRAGRATHHTLGDGDFGHFARMGAEVTAVQAVLGTEEPTAQIDRLIAEVLDRSLPGYLLVPADVGELPTTPPDAPLPPRSRPTHPDTLRRFRDAVTHHLAEAATVSVLADILVQRLGAERKLHALLDTGVPHATLLWGRRVVDESRPNYLGSYLGAASASHVRRAIEDADALVMVGVQFTDLTSGFFSQRIDARRVIEIRGETSMVAGRSFTPLAMADALDVVTEAVRGSGLADRMPPVGPAAETARRAAVTDRAAGASARHQGPAPVGALTQDQLWARVADALRPGDLVLADQGTAYYGMAAHRLPAGATFIGQPLWAAIGYTLPALLGAALAAPERRPVLLIGDGAAQLTIAELGTLLRQGVPAIVVVVDNGGYTIERRIHGPNAPYNDIASWDWLALVGALGGTADAVCRRVTTGDELSDALAVARDHVGFALIQAIVDRDDVPPVLEALAQAAAQANRPTP